jgi:hypothetical protein
MPKPYDRELKAHADSLRLDDEWYGLSAGGGIGKGKTAITARSR